ncbi:ribosome small subunit-dependent GTPase A [Galactobacter valiniphilus]|uniref:Small ribosomal subunit biogenesis GTPase RsgA n=1 Tax=Galactobacter valiniphilus TaxID=2676122 RepID=A0A399JDB7_9MICC|nr:ribosome small subunit-dependent GTPase A [Galactobacter valiniphilus]RII43030.1 ribosome small subunit-dependent GTPase A [Galactobacter valiniphilus]
MSGRQWDESDVRIRPNKKGSRPRTKDRPKHEDATIGRVIGVDRGRYTTVVDEGTKTERTVLAMRARELRRQAVVPGDRVALVGDISGGQDALARLVRIEERSTLLRRSADDTDPVERAVVANADQVVVVVAAADPEPRPGFIDRTLVAAHDAGITPVLVITKADLREPTDLLETYVPLGLDVVVSRAGTGEIDENGSLPVDEEALSTLHGLLDGHVSALLGHSGVGKSTLVNALTGAGRATGGVNKVTGRGRHTSSSAIALKVPESPTGTWVVDTPGVRSFGLAHVDEQGVVDAFEDLVPATAECARGCTHAVDAPGCALDAWVEEGKAGPHGADRLASLRKLLASRVEASEDVKELGEHGA